MARTNRGTEYRKGKRENGCILPVRNVKAMSISEMFAAAEEARHA